MTAVVACVYLIIKREGVDTQEFDVRARRYVRWQYVFFAVGFTVFAFYGSLVPFQYTERSFAEAMRLFRELPLVLDRFSRTDLATNVALMIPVAFFWMAVLGAERWSRSRQLVQSVVVFFACVCLAFANEFTQLWFARVPSKIDIVAQMVGALIGIGLWLAIGRSVTQWLMSYATDDRRGRQVEWWLEAYLIGFIIYSLMPFDLTANVTELGRKLKNGRIELIPFQRFSWNAKILAESLRDVVLFIPVGMLAAVWRTTSGRPVRTFFDAAVLGTIVAATIESLQVMVRSRYASITDVFFATAGVTLGVWIMRRWRREEVDLGRASRPSLWHSPGLWCVFVAGYIGLLTLPFWNPFDFDMDWRHVQPGLDGFFAFPFARIVATPTLMGVSVILHRLLWFAPLGALTAVWISKLHLPRAMRRLVFTVACFAVSGIALVIEMGQILLPSRVADVTDVLLGSIGAWLGLFFTASLLAPKRSPDP